ncbi:MAG: heavy-metal-associated domain-containing protein [Desulfuromonadales bacterium]|nr:heavy-metal-associated domain-containing protein [Desulfuromonadales bacterium]
MHKKRIISSVIISALLIVLAAMFVVASESPAGRAEYLVPRITCGACVQVITADLEKLAGVSKVEVDVATTTVKVAFDEKRTDAGEIALALNQSGYPGSIVALNGRTAPGAVAAKKAGGCGCCDPTTR